MLRWYRGWEGEDRYWFESTILIDASFVSVRGSGKTCCAEKKKDCCRWYHGLLRLHKTTRKVIK